MNQRTVLSRAAEQLLSILLREGWVAIEAGDNAEEIAALMAADLIERAANSGLQVSAAGRAYLARRFAARSASDEHDIDPFLAQHLAAKLSSVEGPNGRVAVRVNDAESPLMWLARRKTRDGAPLISPVQLQGGERLRADFTRAHLSPSITANWTGVPGGRQSGGGQGLNLTERVIAARQRVRHALEFVGPEFAGLLLDVCCFLKRLEDVERERQWPVRSAKVVLQLGLDRLARHYGLEAELTGPRAAAVRIWLAPDATFVADPC